MTRSLRPNYALLQGLNILAFLILSMICRIYAAADSFENGLPPAIYHYRETLPRMDTTAITPAEAIIDFLLSMRPGDSSGIRGREALTQKITRMMASGDPLHLVLVGYPFKSTNIEKKVISAHVDMGELTGLLTLNHMCQEIEKIYSPGAVLSIYTDGAAYTKPLDVTHEAFEDYQRELAQLLQHFHEHIKLVRIHPDLESQPEPTIDEETKKDMAAFMEGELDSTRWNLSKSARKRRAKELAEIFAKNSARFGQAVREHLESTDYIRLSIHPHEDISAKLTVPCIMGSKGTPWHGSPYIDRESGQIKLGKKKDLAKLGYTLQVFNIDGLELSIYE